MFDILYTLVNIIYRIPPYNMYCYLFLNLNVNPVRKGKVKC